MKDILERLEVAKASFPIIDERPDQLFDDAIRELKQLRLDVKVHQGFSELWYFVMDEAPLEFEEIVRSWSEAMKKVQIAVVQLLIDAENENAACDRITALLTENMQKYVGKDSCLIDWEYGRYPKEVLIPDDYEPDKTPMPSFPKVVGTVTCDICGELTSLGTAHLHQDEWVGECCWDDRLKSSE